MANARQGFFRPTRWLATALAAVIWVAGASGSTLAATSPPVSKHVVHPYICKQWGYSFVVPGGWAAKHTGKQSDRCSKGSGASPDFYSKDKRAYLSIQTTTKALATTMTERILLSTGSSQDDIQIADRPINGASFRIGTAGVNFRGDGTNYFFLTACAEHHARAYCLTGSIVRDGNYQFAAQTQAMETALHSFRFLPKP
ncbi:MAG TPA: hypothetical protein VNL35_09465 [Chloroflexota bacterium]|nr:hypothetical protein [Chloroflexota bacterium]